MQQMELLIRHWGFFIKDHDIGCVGKQVLFRNRKTQVSAAHIQRKWFHPDDLDALDECEH